MRDTAIGYTGQRRSGVSGHYLLGNGYRGFNPVLKRFAGQDSLSPFGVGGEHGFAYCGGNPVNNTDPSGHLFWELIVAFEGLIEGMEAESIVLDEAVNMAAESVSTEVLPKGTTLYKSSRYESFDLSVRDLSENDWSGTYFATNKEVSKGYLSDYAENPGDKAFLHKFVTQEDINLLRFDDSMLDDSSIDGKVKADHLKKQMMKHSLTRNQVTFDDSEYFTTILEKHSYGYKGIHNADNYEIILRNDLKKGIKNVKTTAFKNIKYEIVKI